MRGAIPLLIQVSAFAALIAAFLVPCLVAERMLGLKSPWPMLIGVCSVITTLLGLFCWLKRAQRKERTPTSTKQHEVFGNVQSFKDRWEASIKFNQELPQVEITGETSAPTTVQVSTFAAIQEQERYAELLALAVDGAREAFDNLDLSLSQKDLILDGIYLSSDGGGSFDLIFTVPAHERKLPWGLTVQFVDFKVDEISDNH